MSNNSNVNNLNNCNQNKKYKYSNLFTHYEKNRIKLKSNNNDIINKNKKNRIQRNRNAHTPILIRKNKTLDKLDLDNIGINNENELLSLKNKKYKINNINQIKNLNIINTINKNNADNYSNSRSSVQYTQTSGGSIVSIHNNKIHGLPILQGVCPRCINTELIILKELNKKINRFTPVSNENYDILENEKKRDEELKEKILLKVKYNKNRFFTETQNYEKNKLIEKNSQAECKLYKPAGDPIKEKVMEKYLKKEQYLKNKKLIPYNINLDADKYLKNNNYITKFSVPSIGLQKHKNKYLPTIDQYIKSLSNQIIDKKNEEEKERQKDKDEFNYYFKENMIKANNDYESKNLIEQQKKKEFLRENQKLMEMRKNQKILDKSTEIALEQKYLKILQDQEKNELEKQKNKKYRIKKELMEKLDEQIKLKRNKSFDMRHLESKSNEMSENNIYRENKKNEQFGRCMKCFKLLRKSQICPREEYDLIKNTEIQNQEKLNNIMNKNSLNA